ncbi:MAG: helical backbone metal receptor [candidate division WOR-3 bacterium]
MKIFSEFFGKVIEIPDNPERIVSLAPDITDTIFKLKKEDKLVGISFYCRRPYGKLKNFLRVGSYLKVLWEKLDLLKPDLILTTSGAQREVSYEILRRGYSIFVLPVPQSIYGIFDNIKKLSIVLNETERGYKLIERLTKIIEKIREEKIRIKVYYEIYLGGKITIGSSSYINDGLRILGLKNIYSFKKESYFEPDDEETKKFDFDLILYEPHNEKIDKKILEMRLKERFGNKKILILPYDFLAHYGPSFIDEVLLKLKKKLIKTQFHL